MKKIFLLLLSFITLAAYSQQSKIFTVHNITVKNGQKMAFEAAYKQHVAKFHKDDKEKVRVFEILSGPNAGSYQIVSGPSTYADMDRERSDNTVHGIDLDKSFFAYLENNGSTNYFNMEDSLSFHGDVNANKTLVTIRHIKPTMYTDFFNEQKRTFKVLHAMKGKFWDNLNLRNYSQLWDGSDQVIVSVRSLKDGFKELENEYFGPMNDGSPTFKDVYIQHYGSLDWDKREKLFDTAEVSREQFIRKLRTDMSSQ